MSKLTRTSKAAGGQKRDVLRRAILEAASRLFVKRGFGGTNLQDIADALGISRPAVYYYYKSKEDILDSLVKAVTVVSGQQAMTLAGTNDFDPIETLRRMVYSHAKWLLEHPLEFRVLERTENVLPSRVRRTHDKGKRALLDNFARAIERGIDLGHLRPLDARVASLAIIGMCSWTAWWFKPDGRLSVSEIAQTIADISVGGLRQSDHALPPAFGLAVAVQRMKDDLGHLERLIAKGNERVKPGRAMSDSRDVSAAE